MDGSNEVCAYGATRFLGVGNFDISYDNIEGGAFWGFAYGYAREVSFAYPLPFEMEPVGCKFSENSCSFMLLLHFSLCLFSGLDSSSGSSCTGNCWNG